MAQFPYFELSGTPKEIGSSAGIQFGARIRKNFSFYEEFFCELVGIKQHEVSRICAFREKLQKISLGFAVTIKKYFPDLDTEICAMAETSNMLPWQIYALNARTEIYRLLMQKEDDGFPCECTALYFPKSQILGQNWDWHPRLEELCIITKIQAASGRSFVMLTEPGIIGKIGLNSEGLGVCLNILFANCKITGIPIHIMLRGILECATVSEAKSLIESLPRGTTSNLLIAHASGKAIDLELRGEEIFSACLEGGELIHTNHFLNEEESASATLPGSVQRLNRAKQLYDKYSQLGTVGMQILLCDKEDLDFPICRSYSMGLHFLVGTVASITMDLNSRELSVFKGQPKPGEEWSVYSLS